MGSRKGTETVKNMTLYIGIAVLAAVGIILMSPRREIKPMQLNIRKLQERFRSLDAV